MHTSIISLLLLFSTAVIFTEFAKADSAVDQLKTLNEVHNIDEFRVENSETGATRDKRTILLKKKLGAAVVGFGLGAGVGAIKG